MPNWCSNSLIVDGSERDIKRFVKTLVTESSQLAPKNGEYDFDFGKYVPFPNELRGLHSGMCDIGGKKFEVWRDVVGADGTVKQVGLTKAERKKLVDKCGADNGYEWDIKFWGTKWNARDANIEVRKDSVQIVFDTAWSPPIPVVDAMSKMFPRLRFELHYDEPGMDFEGDYAVKNGKVLIDESGKSSSNNDQEVE